MVGLIFIAAFGGEMGSLIRSRVSDLYQEKFFCGLLRRRMRHSFFGFAVTEGLQSVAINFVA
jgi:hypothetical protein